MKTAPRMFAVMAGVTAVAVVALPSSATTADERRHPAFAQLSSAVDQLPGEIVQFEQNDGSQGVVVTPNSVTVRRAGTYLVVAAPQVTAGQPGCLNAWTMLNGNDVANSNVRLCQNLAGETDVIISQGVTPLNAGDTVQVRTSGDPDVILDAIQPPNEPLVPSIIFTLVEQ